MPVFISAVLLYSVSVFAQISPLKNFHASDINPSTAEDVWKAMKTEYHAKSQCYNRAHSWVVDMNTQFNVDAKKILIHYSALYNTEISSKWGFHIAPVVAVEGEDKVFDKGFLPNIFTPLTKEMWLEYFLDDGEHKLVEKRIELKREENNLKAEIRESLISGNTNRSSRLNRELQEVKNDLKRFKIRDRDLEEQRPKKIEKLNRWITFLKEELTKNHSTQTRQSIQRQLKSKQLTLSRMQRSLDYAVNIECQRIQHIEELDYNKSGAWCFVQEVAQYYWGIPQLRKLNYGAKRNGRAYTVSRLPNESNLSERRRAGEQFVRNDYIDIQVWIARREAFPDYKELWAKEWQEKKYRENPGLRERDRAQAEREEERMRDLQQRAEEREQRRREREARRQYRRRVQRNPAI